jgi:hypothetical protein
MTTFGIYIYPGHRYAVVHTPSSGVVRLYDTLRAANVAQRAAEGLVGAFPELALPTFAPRDCPAAAAALRRAVKEAQP